MSFEIGKKLINDIDGLYLYNPGYGPKQFITSLAKKLGCKIVNFKTCKEDKMIKEKTHIYTTGYDPISALSFIEGAKYVKPINKLNPHSLSNFTQAGSLFGAGWKAAMYVHRI